MKQNKRRYTCVSGERWDGGRDGERDGGRDGEGKGGKEAEYLVMIEWVVVERSGRKKNKMKRSE